MILTDGQRVQDTPSTTYICSTANMVFNYRMRGLFAQLCTNTQSMSINTQKCVSSISRLRSKNLFCIGIKNTTSLETQWLILPNSGSSTGSDSPCLPAELATLHLPVMKVNHLQGPQGVGHHNLQS